MADKRLCMECLSALHKNKAYDLIEEGKHLKTLNYFTYAEFICNGCVDFFTGPKGHLKGVPKEALRHYHFLYQHFKTYYHRIKRDMPDTEEAQTAWNVICRDREKYIGQTLTKILNEPDNFCHHIDAIINNIYKGVCGRELVHGNKMVIGDIMTGRKGRR
jgi:hypothetical protein